MKDGGQESRQPPVPPWWTDPTENVKAIVAAEGRRQDDLRDMQTGHDRELRNAELKRIDEIAALRAVHVREMRQAETDRIDAIRAVDVGAVNRAAEVSATQATTLATQVATSAEALRGQVEAARQQTATALAAALEPIQKDIQDLRRAQYEAQGVRAQTVETRDVRGETRLNVNLLLSIALGAVAVITLVLYVTKK